MEKQPVQATSAPFRRRRPSRRRAGRRNDSDRPPALSTTPVATGQRHEWPRRSRGRHSTQVSDDEVTRSVETADEGGENRMSEEHAIVPKAAENGEQPPREPEFGEGIIEISGKGFGFLRDAKRNFVQTPQDIFVTPGNRSALSAPRRHVDLRRDAPRQSRPAADPPAQDQRRRADRSIRTSGRLKN